MKPRPSMEKRRKEQARKNRQQEKAERRERRKAEREQRRDAGEAPDDVETLAPDPTTADV